LLLAATERDGQMRRSTSRLVVEGDVMVYVAADRVRRARIREYAAPGQPQPVRKVLLLHDKLIDDARDALGTAGNFGRLRFRRA
jgi:hypothetical protein